MEWDDAGTEDLGNDEISANLAAEEAVVEIPYGSTSAAVDEESLAFSHPTFVYLNWTWLRANDTTRDPPLATLSFESRWKHSGDREWGNFLVVRPRNAGIDAPAVSLVSICWSICHLDGNDFLVSNETEFKLAPHAVWLEQDHGSDTILRETLSALAHCAYARWGMTCPLEPGAGMMTTVSDATTDALPDVRYLAGVGHVAVRAGLIPEPTAEAGAARPAARVPPMSSASAESRVSDAGSAGGVGRGPSASLGAAGPSGEAASGGMADARIEGMSDTRPANGRPLNLVASVVLSLFSGLLASFGLRRGGALDHPLRAQIHRHLETSGPAKVADIARAVGASHNLVKHHIRVLLECRLVERTNDRQPLYFAAGAQSPNDCARVRARAGWAWAVLAYLRVRREATYPEMAEDLGILPSTLTETIKKLVAWDLVSVRAGRPQRVRLREAAGPAREGGERDAHRSPHGT